jgi:penicillin-binding protein 2
LYLSLDVELQQLGEKLMTNKVGSIVAIDPRTGGILCMVSSPTYDPNYLTGHDRRKHYGALALDPRLPLINRTANSKYSPGSTFKTIVGIIGLTEGVITDKSTVYCPGAFYCGNRRMGCLDPGTFQIRGAIAHSCNTYFATVYKRILDQPRYGLPDSALKVFNGYAYSFGLGKRLGMDVPTEKFGNIPVSSHYVKIFGKKWNSCNIISNAIGQGEVETTLAQLANVMATLANKGWYYTPHLVDSIEGSTAEDTTLARFKVKHYTDKRIPDSIFEIVHDGMQGVMEYGTGAAAKVPGVVVCGKTGTVENYYKGVKQKDHAFFGAFAPRDNPRIAIAVICENAGFGASSSAPIASLMIEKYLKDSISGQERKNRVEELAKTNLIPARMKKEMERLDSLKQARLRQIDIPEPEASDSTNTDEEDMQPTPTDKQKNKPKKDTSNQTSNGVAILTNNEKKYSTKKYVRTEA